MAEIQSDGLDFSDFDDRAIQKILREIDMRELVVALFEETNEVRQRVYRNMSKRAQELAVEEIDALPAETSSEPGVQKIHSIIERLIAAGEIIRGKPTPTGKKKDIPSLKIDTSSAESLRESFEALANKARNYGLLSLEDDVATIEDPFFQMGLQLVVDGTDPEIISAILHTKLEAFQKKKQIEIKETVLRMEKELIADVSTMEKIIEGVLSIQSGDNPRIVAEKIRAFEP